MTRRMQSCSHRDGISSVHMAEATVTVIGDPGSPEGGVIDPDHRMNSIEWTISGNARAHDALRIRFELSSA